MAGIDWSGIGKSEDDAFPAGEPAFEQDGSLFENIRVMDNYGRQSIGSEYPSHTAPVYSSQTPSERITRSRRDTNPQYRQPQSQQPQYTSGQSYFDTMPTFDPAPTGSFPGFMDMPEFGSQGSRQSIRANSQYENPQRVSQQANRQQPVRQRPQQNVSDAGQRSRPENQKKNKNSGTAKGRKTADSSRISAKKKSVKSSKPLKDKKPVKSPKILQDNKLVKGKGIVTSQNAGTVKRRRKKNDSWDKKVKNANKKYGKDQNSKSPDSRKRDHSESLGKKQKLLITFVIVIVVIAISSVAAYFISINYLVVSKINVTNVESSTYSDDEIIEATDVTVGDCMLFINDSSVEEKITSKLPYIGKATVKKDWPNVFNITVEETTDKFAVMLDNDYVWLSSDGKVLSTAKKSISNGRVKVIGFYPQQEYEVGQEFTPTDENKEYYDVLKKISSGIDASGLKIKSIEFLDGELVCLTYNKYIKIYGKYDNNYASKLAGVKEILASKEKITVDFYFDIRSKGEIIENYGTFS